MNQLKATFGNMHKDEVSRCKERFQALGGYFGYPKCCTEDFINRLFVTYEYSPEDCHFNGTGYVPCQLCRERSIKDVLMHISSNRQCPTPFPDDSGKEY